MDKTLDLVLETKWLRLKNEKTAYRGSVFAVCNKHAKKKAWNELVPAMRDKEICYEVVFQQECEKLHRPRHRHPLPTTATWS